MECGMDPLLIRVKSTVSPWLTKMVGPGTVPLNVKAS